MGADKKIEEIIRAISAKDATAAGMYHALSAGARQKVLKALSADGLKALTSLIKSTKKRSFAAANKRFFEIAQGAIATPVYLIDETLIEENMRVLQYVKDRTGCKIFHALKAYASFATFPMMSRYLDGTCASGLNEARLGYEKFAKEVHTFGAAYNEKEIRQILKYSDSIIFNSFYQLEKYWNDGTEKGCAHWPQGQSRTRRGHNGDVQPLRTLFKAGNRPRYFLTRNFRNTETWWTGFIFMPCASRIQTSSKEF